MAPRRFSVLEAGMIVSSLVVLYSATLANCQERSGRNKLLYMLIDGFRYDYIDLLPPEELPGFNRLLSEGVKTEYVNPVYPSLSLPNWNALVTGLYSESHGLTANNMFDTQDSSVFNLANVQNSGEHKWWSSEPIWTTATKSGLRTANIYLSRCDVPFDDILPEYCEHFLYDLRFFETFRTNLNKALEKLQDGFDFVMLYTEHLDDAGHYKGPESEGLKAELRKTDSLIVYLLRRFDELELTETVNIVIVSDHGMLDTSPGNITRVEIDDFIDTQFVEAIVEDAAFSEIKVVEGHVDEVYNKLVSMPGVKVYKKEDIPEHLHFKNGKFVLDILLKADPDTYLMPSRSPLMIPPRDDEYVAMGANGWAVGEVPQMRGVFMARGPDFKVNRTVPGVEIVDVYPLVSHILKIRENPNNGTFDRIRGVLRSEPDDLDSEEATNVMLDSLVMPDSSNMTMSDTTSETSDISNMLNTSVILETSNITNMSNISDTSDTSDMLDASTILETSNITEMSYTPDTLSLPGILNISDMVSMTDDGSGSIEPLEVFTDSPWVGSNMDPSGNMNSAPLASLSLNMSVDENSTNQNTSNLDLSDVNDITTQLAILQDDKSERLYEDNSVNNIFDESQYTNIPNNRDNEAITITNNTVNTSDNIQSEMGSDMDITSFDSGVGDDAVTTDQDVEDEHPIVQLYNIDPSSMQPNHTQRGVTTVTSYKTHPRIAPYETHVEEIDEETEKDEKSTGCSISMTPTLILIGVLILLR